MNLTPRLFFSALAATCLGLLAYGYYLQFFQNLEPCPMCIFQRLCFMAVVLTAIVGALHGPKGRGLFGYLTAIGVFSVIGAGIAARQSWLQHLPPELVPECGPDLEFMLEMYPLLETVERALKGTGDCAEVSWRFLSLSIAEWSLVCFTTILFAAAWLAWRQLSGKLARG
ncbi:MAG: disulfide bond formation protein B [Gammaproteobacteria bacterium]|jgi:disulfide bond formation protein DsbB